MKHYGVYEVDGTEKMVFERKREGKATEYYVEWNGLWREVEKVWTDKDDLTFKMIIDGEWEGW